MIRSLLMHRFRSFLSVLGIMIGVASLVTMLAIGEGTKRASLEQIESLGIQNIFIRSLSPKTKLAPLNNLPGLFTSASIRPIQASLAATLQEIRPEIVKTTPSLQHILTLSTKQGRFLCDLDTLHRNQVCVLGATVARSLGPKGTLGQTVRIGDNEHVIVGILADRALPRQSKALSERNYDQTILLPLYAEAPTEMILNMPHQAMVASAAPLIQRIMSGDNIQFVIPLELLNQAKKSQRMFHLVLGLIAATSLLVGGIGIANVMLASVYERRSEIGIRRAIGATQKDILHQFLCESLLLTGGGTFMGVLLGCLGSFVVGFVSDWSPVITTWSLVLALIMSIVVGISAGVYPAYQASHVDPMEALRS